MKPLTPRKRSAPSRIQLNSFWNQLEELVIPRQQDAEVLYETVMEPYIDPETLACDKEVEAVFSNDNSFNSSLLDSGEYTDSAEFLSSSSSAGSCWSDEPDDLSCYCSAASSCSSSPPLSHLAPPLAKRMPLPPGSLLPKPLKGGMPMPPTIQETLSLLELLDRFQTFRLCTAV
jgi:hypothetical protein